MTKEMQVVIFIQGVGRAYVNHMSCSVCVNDTSSTVVLLKI